MRPGARLLAALFALFLAGCGTVGASPQQAAAEYRLVLITPAAQASPTPTAFLPPAAGHATATSLYYAAVPTLEPAYPTPTASPAAEQAAEPSPTVDAAQLFPTSAAPPPPSASSDAPGPLPTLTDSDTINFLLIGSDKRPGSSFRTDTMVIVILWPKDGQVSMISIPRDLWIYIPTVGMQRINTAYQSGQVTRYEGGGPGLLRDTIAYNLGIRIDHMAMVEFDGFRRIIDTLGGVDVPVACSYTDWHLIDPSYDPNNANNWSLYTVESGMDHVGGGSRRFCGRSSPKPSAPTPSHASPSYTRPSPARLAPTSASATW